MTGRGEEGPDLLREALPEVSRETLDRLEGLVDLLRRWQKIKNLVSPSSLDHVWMRHVLDSAQLIRIRPEMRRIADLGSGAGFPGLVLAVLLANERDAKVHLVESNVRKSAFLRTAARELSLPVSVHPTRIEDTAGSLAGEVDTVTARALAPLSALLGHIGPMAAAGAVAVLHKGAEFEREIADARTRFAFDVVIHESMTDPAGRILEISRISERDQGTPS
ncbi:16S rRNA (guanine(527)-N(7))-methyltransferase RsmG [Amorphus orientalis]|uniref:Ribosomal RNA small subunit methyltransferase G n=1 Tax=Amorphus orientalis TaxID=649198 RepID=A0AAE3VL10_9HYPH|nr:16S rRNA (guanine(527)-N(7))-methyltransferase RsmG [Amorphus orientalis]MDQ0313735.1 16S rRNA (guanine527-N7)-methyltransferase [Amorphus orientalis]